MRRAAGIALAATGGSSEVVGETVVIGVLRGGAQEELAQVKRCVG